MISMGLVVLACGVPPGKNCGLREGAGSLFPLTRLA